MGNPIQLVIPSTSKLPALFTPTPNAAKRFVEFFTANNEEPRPSRRGLLTIQAALDPSPARLGAEYSAESWPR